MKNMVTVLIIVGVLVIVVLLFLMPKGRNVSQYDGLKKPKIVTMDHQKMLVVEAKGDPNIAGKRAFGLLLKTYYKTKETPKGPKTPAPRARWSLPFNTPKPEWVGLYGMPVPGSVTQLPAYRPEPGLKIELTTWEYGDVAEILHVGPYDREAPTVNALMQFISEQGYEVVGPHEEEYLKGPGMFSRGNPEKYCTIIRYRVRKAGGLKPAADTTQ
jgi:hypothetical protein